MGTFLTEKQQRFLEYLKDIIARRGKAPSLREAAGEMGVSHGAISQMVRTLEEKGVLRRDGRYGRNLYLLNTIDETADRGRGVAVPIVGRIAAGLPLYAQQEWDGSVVVDGGVYTATHLFALRVRGDSMQEAAILDGDLVICEPCQYAENGDIVVALVREEEATVKRFFRRPDHIELRPENTAYRPMAYAFNEVLIQGKVVGVLRGPAGIQ